MEKIYLQVQNKVARRLGINKINSLGVFEQQIIMLPFWFAKAINRTVSEKFLIDLACANLYGWIAYDIYDDFIDCEAKTALLPIANICHRELVCIYQNLFIGDKNFKMVFSEIMDRVDRASIWELSRTCLKIKNGKITISKNLPKFKINNLVDRSLGHALGPIAILFELKYNQGSMEFNKVVMFFKFYLAARQLSDDVHDWWDDLSRARLNACSVLILKDLKGHPVYLGSDELLLRKIFWIKVVPQILNTISGYLDNCLKILDELEIIEQPACFIDMVKVVGKSIYRTRTKYEKIKKYFKN